MIELEIFPIIHVLTGEPLNEIAAIREAIEELDPDNPKLWTSTGVPRVTVLEAALGHQIAAAQRDEAWAQLSESPE